jgi:hypothetical protein
LGEVELHLPHFVETPRVDHAVHVLL